MTAPLPAYMADLERLVNIDCGTYNKAGVDEVGRWFAAQMTSMGADVSVDPNESLATRSSRRWKVRAAASTPC